MSDIQLPQGWSEVVDPATGTHFFINEVTTQQTTVKPPNEVLPDGWTHVYYEQYQKFGYMELGTNKVVGFISDIPGYIPPQEPQQPPQPSTQSDLPKGWIEKEQDGVRWYGCESTGQWTQVKPPNETLPDGWTHVYYEQYQRFMYMNLETNEVVGFISDIPGCVPPQEPQQQQPHPSQSSTQSDLPKGWSEAIDPATGAHSFVNEATTQQTTVRPPNEVLPDGWTHVYYDEYQKFAYMKLETNEVVGFISDIPGYVPPQEQQQQQQPHPSQSSTQNDLPKGWSEIVDPTSGAHSFVNEATTQQTTARPPNEDLPDGWTHVYYDEFQKFAYMNLETNEVVGFISDIPGYVPPQEPQQQQQSQLHQASLQSDLPQGWSEAIDPTTGAHFFINEVTTQQTTAKPPNEDLPDGWTHVYYEQSQKFAYMNLGTKRVVASISDIPGYVPPQEPQQQPPSPPQPSPQSDLPKGWIEEERDGVRWYGCEPTGQWTQAKPPNEVLPDGWFHYYVEAYKRFGYANPSANSTVWNITDIPDYIPPQEPQQQQESDDDKKDDNKQDTQEEQQEPAGNLQVTPSDGDDDDDNNDDTAAKQDESQQSDTTEDKKDESADQDGHQEQSNPQPQQEPPQPQQTEPSDGLSEDNNDDSDSVPESDKLPDAQEQQQQVEQSDDAPKIKSGDDNIAESNKLPDAQEQNQPKQSDGAQDDDDNNKNDSESDKLPDTQQQVEQSDDSSEDNNKDGKNDYESNKLPESQEQQQPEPSDDAPEDNNDGKNDSGNDKLSDAQEQQEPEPSDDEPKIKGGDDNISESDKMSGAQEQNRQNQPGGVPEKDNNDNGNASDSNKLPDVQEQQEQSDDSSEDNNKDSKNDSGNDKLPNIQEQQQQVEPPQLQVEPPDEVQEGKSDDNALEGDKMPDAQEQNQQNQPGDVPEKDNSDDSGGDKLPDAQEQQPPQPPPQSDLPKGWSEAVDPASGAHFFVNEVTGQQTTARPPNEDLPDGWTHVYYEQFQRFAYMELETNRVVASINDIPGYVPQQEPQQQSQESQQQQQSPQQPPQPSPQSDLPKGWIEKEQDGVHLYGCEPTNQWTQVKPPNEVLPDGWFHYYVEAYKRFGYANPSANSTVWNITDIPDYIPPQAAQQQEQEGGDKEDGDKQGTQEKQQEPAGNLQVTPSGGGDDDTAAKQDMSQQSDTIEDKKDEPADQDGDQEQSNPQPQQEPPQLQQTEPSNGSPEDDNNECGNVLESDKLPDAQQQQPQPPPQNDLPKGWIEKEQDGVLWYGCESTGQWTQVKPPNEVLPDGWTHVYYDEHQRFGYMELGTNKVVASIEEIPGYVPQSQVQQQSQESQQQQQQPQSSPQDDLPKGWVEKEQDGVRWYCCEPTGQWTQVKPPNEVLPDGWTHVYYEQYRKFGYMKLGTNKVVASINEIPGYVPPQASQEQQQQQQPPQPSQQAESSGIEQKNANDINVPDTQPQPSPQSDLPKGWVEKEQDGALWYSCEETGQQTTVKPPNEVLPDGWFHYYVKQYKRFGYFNPSTQQNKWNITAIPGYVPPQEPQQQQPQPSQQSDLPKGWVEKEQDGVRWYGCEATGQWTQVKPPNEVLPDGWTHIYYEQYQKFAYMKLETSEVVASIKKIPGYVPPQEQQQQQPSQSDLPKGWIEKEHLGIHWYGCEPTGQLIQVKPPNEVLPDGWFHYYVDKYERFGYINLSTSSTVWNITDIPGYVPPQEQQQPPQPSPQSDLPKGWIEKEQDGVHWYGCEPTGQWTQVKPPNEVLPDGWTHVYYEQYQKFAYMKLGTDKVVASIEEIPGYVPQSQTSQEQQPPSPPQPSSQSDLPKGWVEKEQDGVHLYGCEATGQWIRVKPPNEDLPDGWFHYYVEHYKRFGYFNPSTQQNKWNITAIPGYTPH